MTKIDDMKLQNSGRSASRGPLFEVVNKGSFASLRIRLRKGDVIKAQSDALVSKSEHIGLSSSIDGGIFGGISRMVGGESVFLQTLSGMADDSDVLLVLND